MRSRFPILLTSLIIWCGACQTQDKPAETTGKTEKQEKQVEQLETSTAEETQSGETSSSKFSEDNSYANPKGPKPAIEPPTLEDVGSPDEVAIIETEKGNIVLEFFPDVAPMHVANYKKLAKAGFYDGTTFHRVLPGFVIQGGDPNSKDSNPNNDGMGGPGYSIDAEFSDIKHVKGSLSMARSQDPNSAGSQFFICLDRTKHLDKKYTIFGKVVRGLDVVEQIGAMKRAPSNRVDRSLPAVVMRKVKIVKKSEVGL